MFWDRSSSFIESQFPEKCTINSFAAMAEVVGLISSVITFAQVAVKGVEYAKTVYQAPQEFEVLQEQLNHFANLVMEIRSEHWDSSLWCNHNKSLQSKAHHRTPRSTYQIEDTQEREWDTSRPSPSLDKKQAENSQDPRGT
jgi:hypothetical protein